MNDVGAADAPEVGVDYEVGVVCYYWAHFSGGFSEDCFFRDSSDLLQGRLVPERCYFYRYRLFSSERLGEFLLVYYDYEFLGC